MTTTREFKKFADRYYAKAFYNNVMFLVKCSTKRHAIVLDACSGPGLFSQKLVSEGFDCILLDENQDYLNEAMKVAPGQDYIRGNILSGDYIYALGETDLNVDTVVFTNASGYFSPSQLLKILSDFRQLSPRAVVANFFVQEDQKWSPPNPNLLIGNEGNKYSFALGDEVLTLKAIRQSKLHSIFERAGFKAHKFIYTTDFKTERLYLLERY